MRFRYRGHTFELLLKKQFIPIGVEEIIPHFYGEPTEIKLLVNGNKLEGKVALVTGGYKGIGFHIAMRLLKDGARVIITGRNAGALKKTVSSLNTPNASYLVWDISDGKVKEHFKDAVKIYGKIDILVNNAGINKINGASMTFETATLDYIHSMNDINVLSTVQMCECFATLFDRGTVLNVISNTAVRAAVGIYWMTKWALYNYTKGLSEKLKDCSKITVNGICPGPTKTDMMFNENSTIYFPSMATKRMGLPEEIGELAFIQILAGLQGKTGEITICDGGETLI